MRILIISSVFPAPPTSGDKIRLFYYIQELAKRHLITLVSFFRTDVDNIDALSELTDVCREVYLAKISRLKMYWNLFKHIFSFTPFIVTSYSGTNFNKLVENELNKNKYDIVFLYQIRSTLALPILSQMPKVFDITDVLYENYLQYSKRTSNIIKKVLFFWEAKKLRRYEKRVSDEMLNNYVSSKLDKSYLESAGGKNIIVVKNGITSQNEPVLSGSDDIKKKGVIFIGNLAYPPNHEAANFILKNVWPRVESEMPPAQLYVIGLGGDKLKKRFSHLKRVIFTGYVKSTDEYYNNSQIVLCPLFSGSGIRNKVLEGMARNKVVITTSNIATDLGLTDNQEALVRDSEKDIIMAIKDVLSAPEKYIELRMAALQFVQKNFNWSSIGQQLEKNMSESLEIWRTKHNQ